MAFDGGTFSLEQCLEALIDYRGKTPRKVNSGVPLVTAKVVKGGRIRSPDEFIAECDYSAWMTRGFPEIGDVVLTTEAPLGEVGQIRSLPVALAQRIVTLRGKEGVLNSDYLLYLLQSDSMQSKLHDRSTGTTVVGIKQSELRKVEVQIPPLSEQRAVASALKALDDRIDNLRQTNTTLEAIAQALFKSWFVDFDTVRAKAEGRVPEGMDAATAALFPSEFEDSELGPMPRGWCVESLVSAFEINPKRTLKKGSIAKYIDMASVPTSGHVPSTPADRAFASGSKFMNGDTLLARITPCLENGKTAHIDLLGDGEIAWGSTEFIVLRPRSPLPPYFGYLLARQSEFRAFAIQAMSGSSGRQRVELGRLEQFQLVVPGQAVATRFGELSEPIRQSIWMNARRGEALAALRDTLLPRLISGKLRIDHKSIVTGDE